MILDLEFILNGQLLKLIKFFLFLLNFKFKIKKVTVHVDESGDEYEEDEAEGSCDNEKKISGSGDIEAEAVKKQVDPNKPRIDEIIPVCFF
jgi:hypothetical protein